MKIAVYGISKSGKDYFINRVIDNSSNSAFHFKGSSNLDLISRRIYSLPFSKLDHNKKREVRIQFTQDVSELEKFFNMYQGTDENISKKFRHVEKMMISQEFREISL